MSDICADVREKEMAAAVTPDLGTLGAAWCWAASAPLMSARLTSARLSYSEFQYFVLHALSYFFSSSCRIIPFFDRQVTPPISFLIDERYYVDDVRERGMVAVRPDWGRWGRLRQIGDAGGGSVLGDACAADVCVADIRMSVLR